jgi:hypothetical protein
MADSWATGAAGEFDIDIEGGSMAPENVPQQRQDAPALVAKGIIKGSA